MSAAEPFIPASEVVWFFLKLLGRILAAVLAGLILAKLMFMTGVSGSAPEAVVAGEAATGILLLLSFWWKPMRWPEIRFPESQNGPSLLDDEN